MGTARGELTKLIGSHSVKSGVEARVHYRSNLPGGNTSSNYTFGNSWVRQRDDTSNAWVVAHARSLPVADTLAEFRWAHERLVKAVEMCDEADLEDSTRLPFTKGKTLLEILPGQCWGHHRQHLPDLETFASSGRRQRLS